jgi:hypothetical protein
MKESQLKEKVEEISQELKQSSLVDKCYKLAVSKGEGSQTVHSCHTNNNYHFIGKELEIKLDDGFSEMGGGEIKVFYKNELVLYGDRGTLDSIKENKPIVQSDGFAILQYHQGRWESEIEKILNSPKEEPKKEVIRDPEVSEDELASFNEKYQIRKKKIEKSSLPESADERYDRASRESGEHHGTPWDK